MFDLSFHHWCMQLYSAQREWSIWYRFFRYFLQLLFYDLVHDQFWYMFHVFYQKKVYSPFFPILTRWRFFYFMLIESLIFINFYVYSGSVRHFFPPLVSYRDDMSVFLWGPALGHSASFLRALQCTETVATERCLVEGIASILYQPQPAVSCYGPVHTTCVLTSISGGCVSPFAASQLL